MDDEMQTSAKIDIHPLLKARWSPRAFTSDSVSEADMRQLFEAARWAPSSFNEQPWQYVYAHREDEEAFQQLLACLTESNLKWAAGAGVLMLVLAKTVFAHSGKENRHAWYDVGAANLAMAFQATHLGLSMRQMAGFDRKKAAELSGVEAQYEPVVMIALGYHEAIDQMTGARPRSRRPAADWVRKL